MKCVFCFSEENLTNEHVFPAFMGGELEVRRATCRDCNGEFASAEAMLKEAVNPLLNLLKIPNRYGVVPNAKLAVEVQGLDLKTLPGFMDGKGEINLVNVVRDSVSDDGRLLKQGFFLTREDGEKFVHRARAQGREIKEVGVPKQIVIEAEYKVTLPFAFSLAARRVVAKIAFMAAAYEYGADFCLSSQFDLVRTARTAKSVRELPLRVFANEGLLAAHLRTAHQHSVMCYLSAGMRKGWAVVALFGGLTYLVELTRCYDERASRQFSIFYDAAEKKREKPIVLADEMTLIGHVLSPATKFEDPDALNDQWFPIISAFCEPKGIQVSQIESTQGRKPR